MKFGLYFASAVLGCGPASLTVAKLENAMGSCGLAMGGAEGQNIACGRALPFIQQALEKYGLTTQEQMAFYISVMALESGNLSYNRNIWPGRAGQGTRSMMMPNNLHAFLRDSPDILAAHPELQAYAGSPYDDGNNSAKDQALQVLMKDEYTFLPGAWWIERGGETMQTGCSHFKQKLAAPISAAGVEELLATCVGVSHDPARTLAYQRALNAVKCHE